MPRLNRRKCRGKYFYTNRFLKLRPGKIGDKTYVIKRSLNRMHKKINNQQGYLRYWDHQFGVRNFTYIDIYQYEGIPVHGYKLIAIICDYFDCIAVWNKIMLPDTQIAVRTISVYGYSPDIWLAKYYIIRMLIRYKYAKIQLEGELIDRGFNLNQVTKAVAKFGRYRMNKYIELWESYMETKVRSYHRDAKIKGIKKYLQKRVKLNYGKRRWKKQPGIKWAYCRLDTFEQNKILKYGDF